VTAPRACPNFRALSPAISGGWRVRVARDTPSRQPLPTPLRAPPQACLGEPAGTCVAAPARPRGSAPTPERVVHAPELDPGPYGIACSTRAVSAVRLPPDETACRIGCNAAELPCLPSWPRWHRPGLLNPPARPGNLRKLGAAAASAPPGSGPAQRRGPPSPGTSDTPLPSRDHRQPEIPVTSHRSPSPATVTGDQ